MCLSIGQCLIKALKNVIHRNALSLNAFVRLKVNSNLINHMQLHHRLDHIVRSNTLRDIGCFWIMHTSFRTNKNSLKGFRMIFNQDRYISSQWMCAIEQFFLNQWMWNTNCFFSERMKAKCFESIVFVIEKTPQIKDHQIIIELSHYGH